MGWTHGAARGVFMTVLILVLAVGTVRAWSGEPSVHAIDVELPNRSSVACALLPGATAKFRLRVPAGAHVRFRRSGRSLDTRLVAPDGIPTGPAARPGTVLEADAAAPGIYELVILDSRDPSSYSDSGRSVDPNRFRVTGSWTVPRVTDRTGTVGPAGFELPFAAERGSQVSVVLARDTTSGDIPPPDLSGPLGPVSLTATPRRGTWTAKIDGTGEHFLRLPASETSFDVRVRIVLKPPTGKVTGSFDSRASSSRIDDAGGRLEFAELSDTDTVVLDALAAAVEIGPGVLAFPSVVSLSSDRAIDGTSFGAVSAGPTVRFESRGAPITGGTVITLPFDVGALDSGSVLRILRRDRAGRLSAEDGPYTIDTARGTISFPVSHFSSYAVVRSALELRRAASASRLTLDAIGATPDGGLLIAESTRTGDQSRIHRVDPETGRRERWAGGGSSTADGAHRTDYRIDGYVYGLNATIDGGVIVADGSGVLRIAADGKVLRIAGQPPAEPAVPYEDGALATACGEISVGWASESEGGDVFALGFATRPEGDTWRGRNLLFRIDGSDGRIRVVAGGGPTPPAEALRPLDADLDCIGFQAALDSRSRVLVAATDSVCVFPSRKSIVRLDPAGQTVETLSGPRQTGIRRVIGDGGALRGVRYGNIEGIANEPGRRDFVIVADNQVNVIWRLDVSANRAHVIAGHGGDPPAPTDSIAQNRALARRAAAEDRRPRTSQFFYPRDVAVGGGRVYFYEEVVGQISVLAPKRP